MVMMMMMIIVSSAGQQLCLDSDDVIVNNIWRHDIWCDIVLSVWVNPHTLAAAAAADDDNDDDGDVTKCRKEAYQVF